MVRFPMNQWRAACAETSEISTLSNVPKLYRNLEARAGANRSCSSIHDSSYLGWRHWSVGLHGAAVRSRDVQLIQVSDQTHLWLPLKPRKCSFYPFRQSTTGSCLMKITKSPEQSRPIRRVVGVVSGILAAASLAFGRCGFAQKFEEKRNWAGYTQAIVLAAWIVLPPVWFWIEYYFVYRVHAYPGENREDFKYGQDQAAKIWLALVTALLGLYFGKDFTK